MRQLKILTLAAATLAASGSVAAAAEQTFRIQVSWTAGSYAYQYLEKTWVPKLEEMTDGDVTLQMLPSGSVVPYKETLDAVGMGLLDGELTATAYFTGRNPAFAILGDLPAGYDTPQQFLDFCREGGGEQALQAAIDTVVPNQVHVVGCGPYKRESLVAAVPIRGVDDLQGIKIRSPEGLVADVFKRAGATPVNIPLSEVFTALQQGVVDAADNSAYSDNDAAGLNDIAHYPIYPGIHSMSSQQFTLNQQTWESLDEADRQALHDWFYAAMNDLAKVVHAKDEELVARDRQGGKITVVDWPQSERDRFRQIARGAWMRYADSTPEAQAALQAHLDYMKRIGLMDEGESDDDS